MTRPSWYRRWLLNPALRQLHAWLADPQPTRHGAYRPRLEELEDRVVPSTLVIDPKNVDISSAPVGPVPQYSLVNPGSDGSFGTDVVPLANGNVVVTDPEVNGSAGAVYLFNGGSGALISTLSGSVSGDQVGSGGVTVLTNGNYVISSPAWTDHMGAVTWGSAATGVSGTVSAANSLVGTSALKFILESYDGGGGDDYMAGAITALPNGNYVVSNPFALTARGTVTWGSGVTGVVGTVSAANSLVGTTAGTWVTEGGEMYPVEEYEGGDLVGISVTALTNGNYVIGSPNWSDNRGAVTWASGTTELTGTVSAANSLIGLVSDVTENPGSVVGSGGITALTNGNYVVSSPGGIDGIGAVTWANGTTGLIGTVSPANSLVGSSPGDQVGGSLFDAGPPGVTALSNGDYVVDSSSWNGGAGAVTWGNGFIGTTGTVSAANSLVGLTPNGAEGIGGDSVGGGGITVLANGNYVVASPDWNGNHGAATWGSGATGIDGTISAANSLIGSSPDGDFVGTTVTPLTNGNYVVGSPNWNGQLGAATWASGATGIAGTISAANSLVGTSPDDHVGTDVTALTDGNYVVGSPYWSGGDAKGAVTWGNGSTGIVGTISATNSLVGSTGNGSTGNGGDDIGSGGVTPLTNGNYVVGSPNWNGTIGAATWGNGSSGVTGTISAANSLLGSTAGDEVGASITALPDGNYVVVSPDWNSKTGAATWGDGTSGLTLDGQNTIDANNSLLGAAANAGVNLTVVAGPMPGAFLADFVSENGGRVTVALPFTVTISPAFVASALAAGTNVVLMANNDITVSDLIPVTPSSSAGSLTLDAGRSILLDASINTGGANLTLIANQSKADGVYDPERDPGNAAITMQPGVTLNTGAGTLAVDLKTSTDKNNNGQGVATLLGLTAGSVTLSPATALGVTLNGTTPGDGTGSTYTQTVVTGPINLGGATLSVNDPGSFTIGQSFVILTSTQPIVGTFAGLPEGGVFTSGQTFEVSYQNDQVTLLVIPLITFSPSILPAGTTGTAYGQTLTASGGMAPYGNFVVSAGTLPAGLTLSTGGTLSGTPTAAGAFTFTVRATDSSPSPGPYPGQQTFTLVITPPGFVYDSVTQVLTIAANAFFEYSQATTVDSAGLHTTCTLMTSATDTGAGGVTFSLPDSLLSAVVVNATATNSTAVLIANDTYVGADGLTHETGETAWMRPGGGILYTYDASGNAITFLQLNGFNTSYAYVGRADSAQVSGVTGTGIENIFVTAGNYSYVTGGGQFHLVSGSPNVYGYAVNSTDQAWQYDAAGSLDAFVASGNAYSYMSGSDTSGNTFFNVAVGFQVTYGIATHGNAIAYLLDSPGNDTFYAAPPAANGATTYSYLSGSDSAGSLFNVAEGFSLVYAESFVGGTDFAYNYDPNHNILNSRWILLT